MIGLEDVLLLVELRVLVGLEAPNGGEHGLPLPF